MSTPSILIVEDEVIIAADLEQKLRNMGYRVAASTDRGADAVALARQLRPDLVLMDICLPGSMDGIAAAEIIRRECDLPVVFITAHSDAATVARAKFAEPFGYIVKPFEEREIQTLIEVAIYKHQADRRVREQREWLRVTLTSIGDAVITCDTESRITFINPVAEKVTGWTAAEAMEQPIRSVFQLVDEQTRLPCEDLVDRVQREGRASELANHSAIIARDGRLVPVEDSAAPILDATGHMIGTVLVFHDVTEKRQAEQALRASEEWNRKLTRLLPVAVYTCDAVGSITFFNEHCRELVGREPRAGEDRWSIAHRMFQPDGTPIALDDCPMAQALRSGAPVSGAEIVMEHPDGRRRWVTVHIDPIRDEAGFVVGAINVLVDVTERRRLEGQMRVQSAALESAANAVAIVSAAGVIEWVNPAFTQLTGYSRAEAVGSSPRVLKSGKHPREFYKEMWDTVLAGRVWRGKVINKRKDGSLYTDEMTITPVRSASGAITHFIAIKQDVTERLRYEELLRESEERFRNLVEMSPDAILLEIDGCCEFANPAALKLAKATSREQMQGKEFLSFVHPDDHAEVSARLRRLRESSVTSLPPLELTVLRLDGTAIDVEGVASSTTLHGRPAVQIILRDITERKRSEKAIRESQERLTLAQQAGHVGVFDLDFQSRTAVWSEERKSIFGLPPNFRESFEAWGEFVHPDDRAMATADLKHAIEARRQKIDHEYRIRRSDGETRWLEDRGLISYDANGVPQRIVGTTIDITREKQAHEKLRQQGSQFRQSAVRLVTTVALAVFLVELSVMSILAMFPPLPHWVAAVLDAFSAIVLISPVLFFSAYRPLVRLLREREQAEEDLHRANEHLESRVKDRTSSLELANEALQLEIRRREALEQSLAEALRQNEVSLARLDALLECAPLGLGFCDSDLRFVRVNRALADLSGVTAEDHLGRTPEDVAKEAPRSGELMKHWRMTLESGEPRVDLDLMTEPPGADGEPRWFAASWFPVKVRSHSIGLGATFLDITERRQATEALKRAHDLLEDKVRDRTTELVASNHALQREIAERRSLEARILQISEAEQKRIGQDLHDGLCQELAGIAYLCNSTQRELTETAPQQAGTVGELSRLILESISHANGIARGLFPVNLESGGLMAALGMLTIKSEAMYRIATYFECPQPVLVQDNTIATHLFRIAQEALSNASKHASANRLVLQLFETSGRIVLRVIDNGTGFAPDWPEKSGLGLETMRFRARSIGATLTIQPGTDSGTIVTCELPEQSLKRNQAKL